MTDPSLPYEEVPGAVPTTGGAASSGVADLVGELRYMIESARPMPLSSSSMINKEELLTVLDEIQMNMPDELRSARWLLKEREEFRQKMRRDGDEIVALARNRAEQMVQRTQVVKAAEARARKIIEQAEAEARRLRLEAEDYCDQKLGSFENVLQRTLQQVGAGRAKLQGNLLDELSDEPTEPRELPSTVGDAVLDAPTTPRSQVVAPSHPQTPQAQTPRSQTPRPQTPRPQAPHPQTPQAPHPRAPQQQAY